MATHSGVSPDDKVTPPEVYFSRRAFIKTGAIAASLAATAGIYRKLHGMAAETAEKPKLAGLEASIPADQGYSPAIAKAFRASDAQTPFQSITHYNNFYEFSTEKEGVAGAVAIFPPRAGRSPWMDW